MNHRLTGEIAEILREGRDVTLATLRADGGPHASTVSYASDGADIYFGCDAGSEKARNLGRDDRIAATVTLPYRDWAQIRGLSLSGRAVRLTDPDDMARVGALFMAKFPEVAQYVSAGGEGLALFRLTPQFVSVLDYRQGFGHVEHAPGGELGIAARETAAV